MKTENTSTGIGAEDIKTRLIERGEKLEGVESKSIALKKAAESSAAELSKIVPYIKTHNLSPIFESDLWGNVVQPHVEKKLNDLHAALTPLTFFTDTYQTEGTYQQQYQAGLNAIQACEDAINYCAWYIATKTEEKQRKRQARLETFVQIFKSYIEENMSQLTVASRKFPELKKPEANFPCWIEEPLTPTPSAQQVISGTSASPQPSNQIQSPAAFFPRVLPPLSPPESIQARDAVDDAPPKCLGCC